jgi:hypothetical protein
MHVRTHSAGAAGIWALHCSRDSGYTEAKHLGFVPSCVPTRSARPPAGPGLGHEIKHDGHRLQGRRDVDTVRVRLAPYLGARCRS